MLGPADLAAMSGIVLTLPDKYWEWVYTVSSDTQQEVDVDIWITSYVLCYQRRELYFDSPTFGHLPAVS